jgi:hypothetical protein
VNRRGSIRRYALGGLCIAVAALAAWAVALGGNDNGPVAGDGLQYRAWSLPATLLPDQERRLAGDGTQTPAPTRQVAEATDIEQQAIATEPSEGVPNGGVQALITFYACYGPNGGYCASPAGPLPLAEGQAACGGSWPMGAVLVIEGDPLGPVVCNDRGQLAPYQVDRFFWQEEDGWVWSAQVGSYASVQQVGMQPSAP